MVVNFRCITRPKYGMDDFCKERFMSRPTVINDKI